MLKNIIAFDCGNSSFRIILGKYDGKEIKTEVIDQVANTMVCVHDYFYWDILRIYQRLLIGLGKAVKKVDKIDSIGICTWGVDFTLYDKNGFMMNNPFSYRNTLGAKVLDDMNEKKQLELFCETGILCDKINSAYMLQGLKKIMPDLLSNANKFLMIPDILNYMFTGIMINEPSELSTSQFMDVRRRSISETVCKYFEVSKDLFCPIGVHGTKIGDLLPNIKEQLHITYDVPVICVPSHDTAAAVLAIPAEKNDFAFISCGTWSLIGVELDEPIINEEVRMSHFTNEVGAFDKITLLKNNAGMFLIQRLKEEYEAEFQKEIDWEQLNGLGDEIAQRIPLFPVNNPRFFNPKHMGEEIWKYFLETGQTDGALNWKLIIRSFQESMACSYAEAIENLEEINNQKLDIVYMVGGGSKNVRLCQATADCTGKRIIAGSAESTSLGNIAAQITYFEPEKTICDIRPIIDNSIEKKEYISINFDQQTVKRYKQLPV